MINPVQKSAGKFLPSPNEKTKLYEAVENVSEVIRHVLKKREAKMLEEINQHFAEFQKAGAESSEVSPDRTQELGGMIFLANMVLAMMLAQDDVLKFPMELNK